MDRRERCYEIRAGKDGGVLVLAALARLVTEVETVLSYTGKNVDVAVENWKSDGTEDERQAARLSVVADIISDEVVESAMRIGAKAANVVATRIGKA